jgi:drug/metabolite transporter (DMT)-like permease
VFAGLLGFILFSELPRPAFYLAAAVIMAGVLVVLLSDYRRRTAQKL